MSRVGKASWLIAGLFILAAGIVRLILKDWNDSLYVALGAAGIALAFAIVAVVKDLAFYKELLTMRTTKHGMNMGVLILLALVFLVSINFLAVTFNKKVDVTSEGLNSLSEQSIKIVKALNSDLRVILLSRQQQQEEDVKRRVQQVVNLFEDESPKVKFELYNALQRPDLAKDFEFNQGPYALFVEYKGKKVKVDEVTEEAFTKAILKVSRDKKNVVYFLTGHGERDFEARTPDAIADFKQELSDLYETKPLRLLETGNVPEDAAVVAIIGPNQQLLDNELAALRAYARKGGRFLVAADPGERHNLAQLIKSFGIEFQNHYVLDPRAKMIGTGNVVALGTEFSRAHEVTKDFKGGMITIHLFASELKRAPDAPSDFRFEDLVKTDQVTVATTELKQGAPMASKGPHVLAMSVTGKLQPEAGSTEKPEDIKEFTAVVFGDSDFLANQLLYQNLNRDLALNSAAFLSKDNELISIRPKMPAGSVLQASQTQISLFLFGFLLPLPIALFFAGGFIWYRRRSA